MPPKTTARLALFLVLLACLGIGLACSRKASASRRICHDLATAMPHHTSIQKKSHPVARRAIPHSQLGRLTALFALFTDDSTAHSALLWHAHAINVQHALSNRLLAEAHSIHSWGCCKGQLVDLDMENNSCSMMLWHVDIIHWNTHRETHSFCKCCVGTVVASTYGRLFTSANRLRTHACRSAPISTAAASDAGMCHTSSQRALHLLGFKMHPSENPSSNEAR